MRTKTISSIVRVAMAVAALLMTVQTARAWTGSGTQDDPWQISTADDLRALSEAVNGGKSFVEKYFRVTKDIDFGATTKWDADDSTEDNYTAIGTSDKWFSGIFDGGNHTISGIRIYKGGKGFSDGFLGLFGDIAGGSIRNIVLSNARITGYSFVGGIVGNCFYSTIENCHVTTTVAVCAVQNGSAHHGGIAGNLVGNSKINDCTCSATIVGILNKNHIGGIVGFVDKSELSRNVVKNMSINAESFAGAICGRNDNGTFSDNYYNNCTVNNAAIGIGIGSDNTPSDLETNYGAVQGFRTIDSPDFTSKGRGITLTIPKHLDTEDGITTDKEVEAERFCIISNDETVELKYTGTSLLDASKITIRMGNHLVDAFNIVDNTIRYLTDNTIDDISVTIEDIYRLSFAKGIDNEEGWSSKVGNESEGQLLPRYDVPKAQNVTIEYNDEKRDRYHSSKKVKSLQAKNIKEGTQVALARGTTEETLNTWTMTMPKGDVELEAEYWPEATFTAEPTAATDLKTGEAKALLTKGTSNEGTVMYAMSPVGTTATPATNDYSTTVPTAEALTEEGTYNVWYYIEGNEYHSSTAPQITAVEVASVWTGSSTQDAPWQISTDDDLRALSAAVNGGSEFKGKYFKMTQDIDFGATTEWDDATSTENNFTAIGYFYSTNNSKYFKGHFDGCGHTVKGIRIYMGGTDNENSFQGLFGQIGEGGSVSHLILDDARITGYHSVGGIAGFNEDGTITDCHVTDKVYIHAVEDKACYHGGIVGYHLIIIGDAIISGCTSRAHITIGDNASNCLYYGGIVGCNNNGTIEDCLYLGGEVGGNSRVGAIVGGNGVVTIENCYFKTLTDGSSNSNSTITAMGEDYPAIGVREDNVTETNVAYARTITLDGDITIGGTANDYAKAGTTPMIQLTTYASGEPATVVAMKYATADGKAWLFAQSGAELSLGYDGTPGEGYFVEEKATKTDGGSDVTSTVYANGTLTVPAYDVTFSATAKDVWGVSAPTNADGSKEHPYVITTTQGLDLLAERVNGGKNYEGKYFMLGNDITYSYEGLGDTESNYTAIGGYYNNANREFLGNFNGQGHTVSGIRINQGDSPYQGLFGYVQDGSLSHVTVSDARIIGRESVGGIVGVNYSGTITDCHVTADVSIISRNYCGGIVGFNSQPNVSPIVQGCSSAANIIASSSNSSDFGGIVGRNQGVILDCLYLGKQVGGNSTVGAIVGYSGNSIYNSYYTYGGFIGKDDAGNNITDNPAIGNNEYAAGVTNVGLAHTITLDDDVALGGTATNYAEDVENPAQYLTAYATNGFGFALALTTGGQNPTTTLYSPNGAKVYVKPSGTLADGIIPTIIVKPNGGNEFSATSDAKGFYYLMPAADVSVSMMTGTTVHVDAKSWVTYYSPQAMSLAGGQQDCALYTISSVGTESATLSAISGAVSKETPLLLWNGSSDDKDILLNFAAEPATPTAHADEFKGTLVDSEIPASSATSNNYALNSQQFVWVKKPIAVSANKCWLEIPTGANSARIINIALGDATMITTTNITNLTNGDWYDLNGFKLQGIPNKKGVYIVDGKKVIVK